jgi:hypothetical protein
MQPSLEKSGFSSYIYTRKIIHNSPLVLVLNPKNANFWPLVPKNVGRGPNYGVKFLIFPPKNMLRTSHYIEKLICDQILLEHVTPYGTVVYK